MEVVCVKKIFVNQVFIFMYLSLVSGVLESHTTLATLVLIDEELLTLLNFFCVECLCLSESVTMTTPASE